MKKCVLVLVMFALAISAYGQTFSIDLHAWRYNSVFRGVLTTSTILPSIGVAYNIGSMEILSEVEFWNTTAKIESLVTANITSFSISAGIAPIFDVTEKLFFTFPILGRFSRVGGSADIDLGDIFDFDYFDEFDKLKIGTNSFGLDLGVRLYYLLNSNWSVFTGAKIKAINYGGNPSITMGSFSESIDFSTIQFFNSGSLCLGIRYSF